MREVDMYCQNSKFLAVDKASCPASCPAGTKEVGSGVTGTCKPCKVYGTTANYNVDVDCRQCDGTGCHECKQPKWLWLTSYEGDGMDCMEGSCPARSRQQIITNPLPATYCEKCTVEHCLNCDVDSGWCNTCDDGFILVKKDGVEPLTPGGISCIPKPKVACCPKNGRRHLLFTTEEMTCDPDPECV